MANSLSKINIVNGDIVEAYHITQSIDAFTGTEAYDIVLSGSFTLTGSLYLPTPTPNQIAYVDNSSRLLTLPTSSYPSLTELSYVKGVTSGIQSQFTGKLDTGLAWLLNGNTNGAKKFYGGIKGCY